MILLQETRNNILLCFIFKYITEINFHFIDKFIIWKKM